MSEIGALTAELRDFVRERDWEQFHDPKNLAMAIASEAGELVSEYRWVSTDSADALTADPEAKLRVQREVGDVAIALLLFCDRTGIDLTTAVREKLQVNAANYPVEATRGSSQRPGTRSARP